VRSPLLSFIFFLISSSLSAQLSFNAGGGSFSGANAGFVSFSVGQPFYKIDTGGGTSAAGVQQPVLVAILGVESLEMPFVKVFPNPATMRVDLEVSDNWLDGSHSYWLYSMDQRTIQGEIINSSITEISLQGLATGPYLIVVRSGNKILKSFTIIKIN